MLKLFKKLIGNIKQILIKCFEIKPLLYFCILSFGVIITLPTFFNVHSFDSFCNICGGHKGVSSLFLSNGRLFSFLLFKIYYLINLPYDFMSIIAAIGTNVFLALSTVVLFITLKNNLQKGVKINILLAIGCFLIFYNPLVFELFLFDESAIICLGIFLVVLSSIFINKSGVKNYLLALLFAVLAINCYQGIMCYLLPISFLILISKNDVNLKQMFKVLLISLIIYGASFLSALVIIKLLTLNGLVATAKFGNFDIVHNFILTFNKHLPESLKYLFGFTNKKIYYRVVILLLIILIFLIFRNKNKKINVLLIIGVLVLAIIMPFIPNLVMSSSVNYTAARMTGTLGILPSLILIFIICRFDVSKKIIYMLGILILIILLLNSRIYILHGLVNIKKYKNDITYIEKINEIIVAHEKETNDVIKYIYYDKDSYVDYYYREFGVANSVNIKIGAVDWAFECGFNSYTNSKYVLQKMSKEKHEQYFKDKNYDKFDKKQFVFEDDKLYLLIY